MKDNREYGKKGSRQTSISSLGYVKENTTSSTHRRSPCPFKKYIRKTLIMNGNNKSC